MKPDRKQIRRWLRIAFPVWAVVSTSWLANTMRTRGVPDSTLQTTANVAVVEDATTLEFRPRKPAASALVFISGSGVAAHAYAPLLRPIAEAGYRVVVIKLPWRFAPLDSHKDEAVRRAHAAMAAHPETPSWVVAGHSLGAALAARVVHRDPASVDALVLIGTTHPKEIDLSALSIPVAKVYGSNDGVAPPERMFANRRLLPAHTKWVEIRGGNHSQFGHYGHQLFDGEATIGREQQQAVARSVLLEMLGNVSR